MSQVHSDVSQSDVQQALDMSDGQRIITVRQLLEAGVHFGHRTERWNPRMRPFIYGARNGIHIIDLQQTAVLFRRAYSFIRSVTAEGRPVLFVGTKKQASDVMVQEAQRAGQFFVCSRWLGGTLTNWATVRQSVDKLRNIERMSQDGTYDAITKKEALMFERKRGKLERNLGGIKDMPKLPGAVFVIDPVKEHIAVVEANRLGIPVVAVADTNADPAGIDYLIPGNDDSLKSIQLFIRTIAEACIAGRMRAKDKPEMEEKYGDVSAGKFADDQGNMVAVEKAKKFRGEDEDKDLN